MKRYVMATYNDLTNNNVFTNSRSHSDVTSDNCYAVNATGDASDRRHNDVMSLQQLDDARLQAAMRLAQTTGEVTPLLKQEIRYLIQVRRLSEGKSEVLEQDPCPDHQNELTEEDYHRRDKRKHQNRVAAQKYRRKKKDEKDILELQIMMLELENTDLQRHVTRLNNELWKLKEYVSTHTQYPAPTPSVGAQYPICSDHVLCPQDIYDL